MSEPTRKNWPARSGLLLGLVGIASGLIAIAADYPELMVVMLGSSALAIVLGCVARSRRRSKVGGWAIGTGLLGVLVAMLLPAT